jgi:hypothetical protein
MSADTVVPGGGNDPQMLNRFSYVRNNPLRFIDPSGHSLGDYQNGPGEYGLDDNPGNWNGSNPDHYSHKELERNSWKEEIKKNGRVWTVKKTMWDENGYQKTFRLEHIVWDEFDRTYAWEALKKHVENKTFALANVGYTDLLHNAGIFYFSGRVEASQSVGANVKWYVAKSGLTYAPGSIISYTPPGPLEQKAISMYSGLTVGVITGNPKIGVNTMWAVDTLLGAANNGPISLPPMKGPIGGVVSNIDIINPNPAY